MSLQDCGHPVHRGTWREEPEILAVAIHQIDEPRMIHRVFGTGAKVDLSVVDPVGACGVPNLRGIACEADQARMEGRNIVGEMGRRIAFGIDGDE